MKRALAVGIWRRSCQALRAWTAWLWTLGTQLPGDEATTPDLPADPWPNPLMALRVRHGARAALRAAIGGVAASQSRALAWLEVGAGTHWPVRRALFGDVFRSETVFILSVPTWSAAYSCVERLGRACPGMWWILESDIERGYGAACGKSYQRKVLAKVHGDAPMPALNAHRGAALTSWIRARDGKVIVLVDDIGPNPCEKSP